MKLIADRIAVLRDEAEAQSPGGIHLPGQSQKPMSQGEVLEVGPGQPAGETYSIRRPMTVQKGDRVVFGAYAGNEIEVDGKTLVVLREDEVLAVL